MHGLRNERQPLDIHLMVSTLSRLAVMAGLEA